MRIVIVGGTGNIGTALVRRLAARSSQDEIHVVARRQPADADALPPTVESHALDLNCDDLRPLIGEVDAVVHLGWLFQPSHRPDVTWHNNVVGTGRLLASLRPGRTSVVVIASSIAAYSPVADHRVVDESWSTDGASSAAYSREKAYVERLLDVFERDHDDVRAVRIRPAFVFQRQSAAQQRRLFGGPLVPGSLLRPGLVPILPVPHGLRLQAIHADDVAAAIAQTLRLDVSGAFNLAADGQLSGADLAALFEARHVAVPPRLVRAAVSAGWRSHLVPAPPRLFDALMSLPTMETTRARTELQWSPEVSARDAVSELVAGLRSGEGGATPPLARHAGGRGRWREVLSGVGERADHRPNTR